MTKVDIRKIVPRIDNKKFHTMHISKRYFHLSSKLTNRYNIYDKFEHFLQENPHNEETQRKLEEYLHDFEYLKFQEKSDAVISGIATNYINKSLRDFLFPYKEILTNKINIFLENSYDLNSEDQNIKAKAYLIEIIKVIKEDYVISVIFGRFMRIITNNKLNLTNHKNIALDIIKDIAEDLIRQYIYSIYLKDKMDKLKTYTLSDWKEDNKDLINSLDDINIKIFLGSIIVQ